MKRQTLNAEKRKSIEGIFQSHWIEHSPHNKGLQEAKEEYNQMRPKMLQLCENIVRQYQPQQDVDTIRAMIKKYDSAGGELYHDNCFNFETDIVDDEGKPDTDKVSVSFCLEDNRGFARAYYRDELIKANCDPDYQVKWCDDNKRNPKYYEEENKCDTWLGFRNSSNEDKSIMKPSAEWDRDKIWVIGTSYCHSRQFKVDQSTFEVFKMFNKVIGKVATQHEQLFNQVEEKMKKFGVELGDYGERLRGKIPEFIDVGGEKYTFWDDDRVMCDDPECGLMTHCLINWDEEGNYTGSRPPHISSYKFGPIIASIPKYTKNNRMR